MSLIRCSQDFLFFYAIHVQRQNLAPGDYILSIFEFFALKLSEIYLTALYWPRIFEFFHYVTWDFFIQFIYDHLLLLSKENFSTLIIELDTLD